MVKTATTKRITVRLPQALHDELLAAAAEDNRSLNQEIVYQLRQHVEATNREMKSAAKKVK